MIEEMLKKYSLVSDQVDRSELRVLLHELERTITSNTYGDIVEFGCYKGTTSLFLSRLMLAYKVDRTKKLYLYDSFMGLPDKTLKDSSIAGCQFVSGELAAAKKDIIKNFAKSGLPRPNIKKAWFSELVGTDIPNQISFAFFDGDFYESIKDSFRACSDNFSPGSSIVVDDYDSEALPGASRATDEWVEQNGRRVASFRVEKTLAIIRLR